MLVEQGKESDRNGQGGVFEMGILPHIPLAYLSWFINRLVVYAVE